MCRLVCLLTILSPLITKDIVRRFSDSTTLYHLCYVVEANTAEQFMTSTYRLSQIQYLCCDGVGAYQSSLTQIATAVRPFQSNGNTQPVKTSHR